MTSQIEVTERDPVLRACVVTSDRKLERAITRTLVPRQFKIYECKTVAEAVANTETWDLMLLDYDARDPTLCEVIPELVRRNQAKQTIIFSQSHSKAQLLQLLGGHDLTNLIAKNGGIREDELLITIHKILTGDLFGLTKYLNHGAVREEVFVHSSTQRAAVLESMAQYFKRCSVGRRFIDLARSAAEEVLANAIWSAPTDGDGNPRYASRQRSARLDLDEHETVSIQYACDGRQIGIAVTDQFGNLTGAEVRAHLARCFAMDRYEPSDGISAGAGLGLFLAFKCVDQLIVNVSSGNRTEVLGLIDIRGSVRDFEARSKSFHLFVEGAT